MVMGKSNISLDIFTGIANLIFFLLLLIASLFLISFYRKKKIERELKKRAGKLIEVGVGYAKSPLQLTQQVLKWW